MNERIRQLAEQAFDKANNGTISDIKIPKEFIEKFAELIVRECAKSVNDWYQNHNKIHCDPMSYVLAHFGVKE